MIRFCFLTLLLAFALSACASFFESPTQEVTVLTHGSDIATCYLANPDFKYRAKSGETILIQKSPHDMQVTCMAPGFRDQYVTVPSDMSAMAIGNVANGIVPGTYYDHETKALYKYPSVIEVDFRGTHAKFGPMPEHNSPEFMPARMAGVEYHGPDVPILNSDGLNIPMPPQKRDPASMSTNPFGFDMAAPAVPDAEAVPAAETASPPAPTPAGTTADDLTRQMNPDVFNK